MKTRHITERAENRRHRLLQTAASLPACVGVVMIAVAGVAGVPTSLLLEDAAESTVSVEFCFDGAGATSALPLAGWLWFFWAV